MTMTEKVDAQEKELARLLEWIRQADAKSQIVVGANLALIGAVLALTPKEAKTDWTALLLVLAGCVLPSLSLYACLSASQPHTKAPGNRPQSSLIYFKLLQNLTFDAYAQKVSARTCEEYLDDLTNQCHANAEIAEKKYRRIRTAWLMMFWSIPPWLVILLILFRGGWWQH
jgi:hypothetical protein